ncbi:hypothetical protein BS47DRAFT_1347728 [Hydnum rufescens UP504]|uniref:Uncharacterized protein n=1 Tax=Hydnum rufescens UP504 TaxID=1448309 RepID=A0A9P6ARI0_9AGAM|nr:hypothetical protein BS47DRAFT_1347728 [Hydnum rufescens UP504]
MHDQACFRKFTALPALKGCKLFPHGFATPSLQAHIFFKTHTKTHSQLQTDLMEVLQCYKCCTEADGNRRKSNRVEQKPSGAESRQHYCSGTVHGGLSRPSTFRM